VQRKVFIGSKDEFTRLRAPPPADAFSDLPMPAAAGLTGLCNLKGGSCERAMWLHNLFLTVMSTGSGIIAPFCTIPVVRG
jgi:hypothetical protein